MFRGTSRRAHPDSQASPRSNSQEGFVPADATSPSANKPSGTSGGMGEKTVELLDRQRSR